MPLWCRVEPDEKLIFFTDAEADFSFWLRLRKRREDDETWPYSTDTMGRKLFGNLDQFVTVLPLDHQSSGLSCGRNDDVPLKGGQHL